MILDRAICLENNCRRNPTILDCSLNHVIWSRIKSLSKNKHQRSCSPQLPSGRKPFLVCHQKIEQSYTGPSSTGIKTINNSQKHRPCGFRKKRNGQQSLATPKEMGFKIPSIYCSVFVPLLGLSPCIFYIPMHSEAKPCLTRRSYESRCMRDTFSSSQVCLAQDASLSFCSNK